MKLNLGCSDRHFPAPWVNVDMVPPADRIVDLREPWPWLDSSVEEIRAWDIIEHLPDKIHTMNEAWRALQPGGRFDIEVPTIRGAGAVCDPTHVSLWSASDFEYYEKGNFARERFRYSPYYGIRADFRILSLEQKNYPTKYDDVWKVRTILEAVK